MNFVDCCRFIIGAEDVGYLKAIRDFPVVVDDFIMLLALSASFCYEILEVSSFQKELYGF